MSSTPLSCIVSRCIVHLNIWCFPYRGMVIRHCRTCDSSLDLHPSSSSSYRSFDLVSCISCNDQRQHPFTLLNSCKYISHYRISYRIEHPFPRWFSFSFIHLNTFIFIHIHIYIQKGMYNHAVHLSSFFA